MSKWRTGLAALAACAMLGGGVMANELVLVEDGVARVSVVVGADTMNAAEAGDPRPQPPGTSDADATLLRQAADDLVQYIGRMSGAEIQVGTEPIDGLVPIYVGPQTSIELPVSSQFGDAYMIDVSAERIVLTGESARSSYYAAARLLHQLGVRWYAPGELGEHVPEARTLAVAIGQKASAPDYQTRNLWGRHRDEARWLVRNRMGGPQMPQGHAFARFQRPVGGGDAAEFFRENPDFFPIIGGEVRRFQGNLSNPDLHDHFAEHIRRNLRQGTRWAGGTGEGIGPDDGPILDERPESQAHIRGRRDPMMRIPDSTDLFIHYANALAERLEDEFGDEHLLGFYVYSNHSGVPLYEEPHRMLFPIITPITFTRYSSVGNPRVPTSMLLADITRRWAAMSEHIGFYLYNFNLADTAMPFTRTLAFGKDIPQYHRWGLRYGSIESMTNWHTMVPGSYVIANIMWDVDADQDALQDEVYTNYFGPAANPMRQYNDILEQAYENTEAQSGSKWAMHRILTPDVMRQLNRELRRAESAVEGQEPYASRVDVLRYSLNFAEHWFAARNAMNEYRFEDAGDAADAFLANYHEANEKYPLFFAGSIERYFNDYHSHSFLRGRQMAQENRILYRFPDTLKAFFDEDKVGHAMGLGDPRSLTNNWIDLKTFSATIDEQGFPHYRGLIWYRHDFDMPAAGGGAQTEGLFGPAREDGDDRIRLWVGGGDAEMHVYVNGQNLGQHLSRRFAPFEVDITNAIRMGARNTIVIAADNTGIVELGTGGIMRPVVIIQSR